MYKDRNGKYHLYKETKTQYKKRKQYESNDPVKQVIGFIILIAAISFFLGF